MLLVEAWAQLSQAQEKASALQWSPQPNAHSFTGLMHGLPVLHQATKGKKQHPWMRTPEKDAHA